jgi:Bacterial regulatory proteins, luxR family/MEDS: MEthanogen/methylotroph, DcmR Sensory domain
VLGSVQAQRHRSRPPEDPAKFAPVGGVSGNAFWMETSHWKAFCEYERELDRSLAGQKMIVLFTYSLRASRAVDILDVARAHQCSRARRNGDWEFLETPELRQAKQEIKRLNGALDIMSKPFAGHESLTPRERVTLAQIVRGASSKEAARTLGISPRTIEFHRANVLRNSARGTPPTSCAGCLANSAEAAAPGGLISFSPGLLTA